MSLWGRAVRPKDDWGRVREEAATKRYRGDPSSHVTSVAYQSSAIFASCPPDQTHVDMRIRYIPAQGFPSDHSLRPHPVNGALCNLRVLR